MPKIDIAKDLDFNKIRAGLLLPTAIGLVIIFLGFMINLVLGLLSGIEIVEAFLDFMLQWGNLVISIIGFFLFMFLFAWTGYRTARKYRGKLSEAGLASALSYAIMAFVGLFFDIVNGIFQMIGILPTALVGGISGGGYEDIAIAIFGESLEGTAAVAVVLCCGFGRIPIGMLINFFVGSVGGMFGSPSREKESEEK